MKYRFVLKHEADIEVRPIYKDDLSIAYERESEQMFFRAKLTGKMTFINGDYDAIMSKAYDYTQTIEIYKQDAPHAPETLYHTCKFTRIDCEIDADNRILDVQPEIVDDYTDVLAGMEKEYNLMTLALAKASVSLDKRPLLQLYIPNTNIVSCFLNGMNWQQDAIVTPSERELKNVYHFTLSTILKEIKLTNAGSADGLYVGRMDDQSQPNQFTGRLYCVDNMGYYIYLSQKATEFYDEGGLHVLWEVLAEVRNLSTDEPLYRYTATAENPQPFDTLEYTMTSLTGAGDATADQKSYNIYVRMMCDVEKIFGVNTQTIPTDDIVTNNRNYRRCVGYKINVAYISGRFSNEPTEWGRADDGRYFLPPQTTFGQVFYPLAQTEWKYASLWFAYAGIEDILIEQEGRKTYTLKDAYSVGAVIKALLAEIAPNVTHEETPEYSQFLYGQTNPITHEYFRLLVTQKSNLLVGEYQEPASQVPATLQEFTNMLRNALKCYWFIENGKFKIEHISFFEGGGEYFGTPAIGYDLTTMLARNRKPWAYMSGRYKFEKELLPERYQFSWMDDVTAPFKGNAIDIIGNAVQLGKVEDVNIANFTTDIDFILLDPSAVSQDGFAMFAASRLEMMNPPQSEFAPISSSGTLYTSPTFAIIEGISGIAKLEYRAVGGFNVRVAYYIGDTKILGENLITNNQRNTTTINIPAGTTRIGFHTSGLVPATITPYSIQSELGYRVAYKDITTDGVTYTLQNGILSMFYIQPNFWRYDLPTYTARINGQNVQALSIKKAKTQEVTFPVGANDPNPLELVKTTLGNGQIENITINLASRSGKATLKYGTN